MRRAPPLTWTSVIGYGLGDMANNLVFSLGALFLLNYYTDVAGIGAAAAGTLLASVRIYNAVIDVFAGRAVDRTSSRWGRCRPYLLWCGPALLLSSVAVFSVPSGWDATEKLVYAYASYGLLITLYSFVNIPYGSLASTMTQVPHERARLSASRTLMAVCTSSFLAMFLAPVVRSATGSAAQTRLTLFVLILAFVGSTLYFLCFKATRETVERRIERPKLKESLGTLFSNRPLLILCASTFCMRIGSASTSASLMYYALYVLGDFRAFPVIVMVTTLFATLAAAPFAPLLTGRLGKNGTSLLGIAIAVPGYLALFLAPATNEFWIFALFGTAAIGKMLTGSILWALAADTVEYGEWRTGVRVEGLTYSFFSFSRKCGQALGGSVPAFLLAASGYVPNLSAQSETARQGIQQAVALVPAIAFAVAFLLMLFYPLTDRRFSELVREIGKNRGASPAAGN